MAHYFDYDPNQQLEYNTFTFFYYGRELVFETCSGVFSKDSIDAFSLLMVSTSDEHPVSGKVLDLGCGYGAVGILLKIRDPKIDLYQSDVNPLAVELTIENCRINDVESNVICSDGYERIDSSFDWVFFNPPIRAGNAVIHKLFDETKQRLNPNGKFMLVMQRKHGAASLLATLQTMYNDVTQIHKKNGVYVVVCSA